MRFAARTTLFMVAAAAAVYAAASGPASAETVVKIGGALSMTGPAAVYAVTGIDRLEKSTAGSSTSSNPATVEQRFRPTSRSMLRFQAGRHVGSP